MAFIAVPNTAQVNMRYIQDGQNVENVLYFKHNTPIAQVELQSLADQMAGWYDDYVKPQQAASVAFNEVYAVDLSAEDGAYASNTDYQGEVGSLTSPALPNNVSWAVSFRTGVRGRSGRGRNYIIGLTEADCTANTLGNSTVLAWVAVYDVLKAGTVPDGNWTWSVVSRFHDGLPRSVGLAYKIGEVSATDTTVDSQRRRLPGRGR